jgi:HD-like signal output (HDOD) protein
VIRDLLATADVFHAFEDDARINRVLYEQILSDCLVAAEIAGEVGGQAPEAGLTGMLHDVGLLALAVCLPDELAQNLQRAHDTHTPLHVVEAESLGTTHAEIGAYLLTIWGFRDEVVEAVGHHHDPTALPDDATLAHLTYVAATLANGVSDPLFFERPGDLDPAYLARVNLAGPVASWRATADRTTRDQSIVPANGEAS